MTKEEMNLVLDALNSCTYTSSYEKSFDLNKVDDAIEVLEKSLAQPAPVQEPMAGKGKEFSKRLKFCAKKVAFDAAGKVDMSLATMQEMFALIDHVCIGLDSPPAAQPAPVQKLVCQKCGGKGEIEEGGVYPSGDLAYVPCECATTSPEPQQRKPLTDEQIELMWDNKLFVHCGITALRAIIRAIEAAHGIKD